MGKLKNGDRKPTIDVVIKTARYFVRFLDNLVFGFKWKKKIQENMVLTLEVMLAVFSVRRMRA